MVDQLNERRARILRLIIEEYVDSATPVGSALIQRKHGLQVSPATVRLDMSALEEEGYLTHPHTSAGRVPAIKGYRYYIDALMGSGALPEQERFTIRHQFAQYGDDVEQWARLAAAVLARMAGNAALVAPPRASSPRIRRLEFLPASELMVVALVVTQDGRQLRRVIDLAAPARHGEITLASGRLNALFHGRAAVELRALLATLQAPDAELQMAHAVEEMLRQEEVRLDRQPYVEGLRNLLSQPEFGSAERMLDLLNLLEDPIQRAQLFDPAWSSDDTVAPQVVVGGEGVAAEFPGMERLSVVVRRYGESGGAQGAIAVVGPTRMAYSRVTAAVQFLADLLTEGMRPQYQQIRERGDQT